MRSSTLSQSPLSMPKVTTSSETGNDDVDILKEVAVDDPIWEQYVEKAASFDNRMVKELNQILDVNLLYVGLMITALTIFIIETTTQFTPDPTDVIIALLGAIYNETRAQSTNTSIPVFHIDSVSLDKASYSEALLYNGLLYISLGLCIVVSVIALAAKLWLVEYGHRAFSIGTFHDRAMKRQQAYTGILAWKMRAVINTLPLILLVSVVMFATYFHLSLLAVQTGLGTAFGFVITLGFIALGVSSLAAAFIPACPFHSPFSAFIHLVFWYPRRLSRQILSSLPEDRQKIRRWRHIGTLALIWLVLSAVAGYGSFRSSNCVPLVYVPTAVIFSYSMQKPPKTAHKPQKYGLPSLLACVFIFTSPFLAEWGALGGDGILSVGMYIISSSSLLVAGLESGKMSKSMEETVEVDAIAWLLGSTPQDSNLVKKALQIADAPSGRDYHPRLLESLMPVLSSLIVSHRADTVSKMEDLETYVSFLAQLSDFTDTPSFGQRHVREDGKRHPELEARLHSKLIELATDAQYSFKVKKSATQALRNFGLNTKGEKIGKLHKRQMSGSSTITLVESPHSYEETELRPRRQNGYYEVDHP